MQLTALITLLALSCRLVHADFDLNNPTPFEQTQDRIQEIVNAANPIQNKSREEFMADSAKALYDAYPHLNGMPSALFLSSTWCRK